MIMLNTMQITHRVKHINCILSTLTKVIRIQTQSIFSKTQQWDEPYLTEEVLCEIESHWKKEFQKKKLVPHSGGEKITGKKYVLPMFPYPSGQLHMGHARVYTISDTLARFYRAMGYEVIHPIGWDAFGLPAENAAVERQMSPEVWTKQNIEHMRQQLQELGCAFDWDREICTCDPAYYRWTQELFLRMNKAGLTYRREAFVNWDPVDNTVLADEQVDSKGHAWRSGAKVERRLLHQWYIRASRFSESLYDGLSEPQLQDWGKVINAQKNWIGVCDGYAVDIDVLHDSDGQSNSSGLTAYIEHPELLYGLAFIGVKEENMLVRYGIKEGTSQNDYPILNVAIRNPLTKKPIPVVVSNSLPFRSKSMSRTEQFYFGYSNGSSLDKEIIGVHGFEEGANVLADGIIEEYIEKTRYLAEANAHNTANSDELVCDVSNIFRERLKESGPLTGMTMVEARQAAVEKLREAGRGAIPASHCQQDWLISRQRYWGTPIPIIHCIDCGVVPVPSQELPVVLPSLGPNELERIKEGGAGALALSQHKDWINTSCPKCGGPAERETDTMDTFIDSSWYFLRYLDPHNSDSPFGKEAADAFMPVDLYIGGEEHAVLHLYFARLFQHFLRSEGMCSHSEPFSRLILVGRVKAPAYIRVSDGKYLHKDDVDLSVSPPVERNSRKVVKVVSEKMSKSKYNGVDPSEVMKMYSTDITRGAMLREESAITNKVWDAEKYIKPLFKWINLLWRTVGVFLDVRQNGTKKIFSKESCEEGIITLQNARNSAVYKVTHSIDRSLRIDYAIKALEQFNHIIRSVPMPVIKDPEYERSLASMIIMLSPIMPHITSEMWEAFKSQAEISNYQEGDVLHQKWPEVDSGYQEYKQIMCYLDDELLWEDKISFDEAESLSQEAIKDLLMQQPEVNDVISSKNIIDSKFYTGTWATNVCWKLYTRSNDALNVKKTRRHAKRQADKSNKIKVQ